MSRSNKHGKKIILPSSKAYNLYLFIQQAGNMRYPKAIGNQSVLQLIRFVVLSSAQIAEIVMRNNKRWILYDRVIALDIKTYAIC